MPLLRGKSRDIISKNIKELIAAGHQRDQAIAISLDMARKAGAKIPKRYGKKTKV